MEQGSSSSSSSSSASANNGGPDSLNALKFGKKIYFEGRGGTGLKPSPAKRLRAGYVQGGKPPRCQVEGCKVDLSDAKAYYSRHKVCGMHSKSAMVIVAGLEKRFCQQCSRVKFSSRWLDFSDNHHISKTGGFMMDFSNCMPPSLTGGLTTKQTAMSAKVHLPKLISNLQNPPPCQHSHSSPVVSECLGGVQDSNNALSLLSNQARLAPNSNFLGQPSENPSTATNHFICPSWGFKGNEVNRPNGRGLNGMAPDLGLGQAPNGGYNGELELGQPNDGGFHELDVHHVNWSL
ncbi:Squamosa promoter-binding-like protein 15 [Striga hermonthica]|uniref:Squamosa promoter-binding-like protein 15 n=1 Tax=Striga hermonthica TaxID=68872 RepID=A0A9N7R5M6_STRHE|nr:Squamosa promoter-binding-like protein 15 [Striga hermonthica]